MDDEAFGVADVGEVGEELQGFDEFAAGGESAFDAESEDAAGTYGKVFVGIEARVFDPLDVLVFLEEMGDGEGVGGVAIHAEFERLKALKKHEGVEGAERGAEVAEAFDAGFHDVGEVTEGLVELDAVIAFAGFEELGKFALIPGEFATIDDDTAD